MKNLIIKILLIFLLSGISAFSQTEQDTIKTVQNVDSVFVMQKSPWGAVLRSAVLPGWGQFYNESYFKIPVIWGLVGYFGYLWYDNHDQYKFYRNKYTESLATSSSGNESYRRLREFYRDQRDEIAVYFGIVYFLNLVDAYVDAHLFDFDVSENPFTGQPQLEVKFHF